MNPENIHVDDIEVYTAEDIQNYYDNDMEAFLGLFRFCYIFIRYR